MTIIDLIQKRRSIRKFKQESVSDDLIHQLLLAATSAPTAANCEPWEFIIVTDKDILANIRQNLVFARYVAPLAIIVCGNMDLAFKGPGKEMWVQDCSAATQNMLVAAANLELGSVWIGVHPLESNVKALRKTLNIPENVIPLNVVYFGFPDESKESRSRLNEKRIYYNQYDPERKHRKKDKPKIGHY